MVWASEERAQKFRTDDMPPLRYMDRASDWSCREGNLLEPNSRNAQILVVTSHHGVRGVEETSAFFSGQQFVFRFVCAKVLLEALRPFCLCELNV